MGEFIPDYLIREQAAVGALVVFGVLRVLAALMACSRGWPIALVQKCAIGVAGLYCAPQLIDERHDVGGLVVRGKDDAQHVSS